MAVGYSPRMKKTDEVSPAGTITVHHQPRERGWTQAAPPSAPEQIEAHFSAHFGEPESVIHKVISDTLHVDVHIIPPRPEREWWTLFTTGMSDHPMAVPDGVQAPKLAEVLISLPAASAKESATFLPWCSGSPLQRPATVRRSRSASSCGRPRGDRA